MQWVWRAVRVVVYAPPQETDRNEGRCTEATSQCARKGFEWRVLLKQSGLTGVYYTTCLGVLPKQSGEHAKPKIAMVDDCSLSYLRWHFGH